MAGDEFSSPIEDQAKEQAALVLTQLVEALADHFKPLTKSQARAIVRQAMQEL